MANPCFEGENYIVDRHKFAAGLQINNFLHFNKPVHVNLGDLILRTEGNVVKISSYGIHLVECDENTFVCPIPLTTQWLFDLGFSETESGQMFIKLPTYHTAILLLKPSAAPTSWFTKLVFGGVELFMPVQNFVHQLQNLYTALSPGHFLTLVNNAG